MNKDWHAIVFGICATLIILTILSVAIVQGQGINMEIIKKIESNGNSQAISSAGAIGLYQITPICLEDYNIYHEKEYYKSDLLSPGVNRKIAEWYIKERVPQMLRHYDIKVSVRNILWSYNAGISKVRKNILPQETSNYIQRYFTLQRKSK